MIGRLRILGVEFSDMQFDDDENVLVLFENTDYWITYEDNNSCIDTDALVDVMVRQLEGKGIINSKNYVGILDVG